MASSHLEAMTPAEAANAAARSMHQQRQQQQPLPQHSEVMSAAQPGRLQPHLLPASLLLVRFAPLVIWQDIYLQPSRQWVLRFL